MEMNYGGAGLFVGFRLADSGSAYSIVQADGTTPATTMAHASIKVDNYMDESNLAPQSDGSFKGTIGNYDVAEAIIDALNLLAKKPNASAGSAPAAVKMETGLERAGSAATLHPLILWMSYGPKNAANTLRLLHWGIGRLGLDSGQIVFKDGQWIKPVINFTSIAAEYALAIPDPSGATVLWEATLVDVTAGTGIGALTVPQYSHYERDYLKKGTL